MLASIATENPNSISLVKEYASRKGWPIARNNIMVEGDTDCRYFYLADRLYKNEYNKKLICSRLSIFPPGTGNAGGTYGIIDQFPTIRNLAECDIDRNGRVIYKVILLMDNDDSGKKAAKALKEKYSKYVLYRDIFLLNRIQPSKTRDPGQLHKEISERNELWKDMQCEIEDLIDSKLVEYFLCSNLDYTAKPSLKRDGFSHHYLRDHAKAPLYRFVEENAIIDDLKMIIDTLIFLRFQLGLNPEGE
jgi:hypothetical protein